MDFTRYEEIWWVESPVANNDFGTYNRIRLATNEELQNITISCEDSQLSPWLELNDRNAINETEYCCQGEFYNLFNRRNQISETTNKKNYWWLLLIIPIYYFYKRGKM